MGEPTGYPRLSDEATQHLAILLSHRPEDWTIVAAVYPERCGMCKEIADWSVAVVAERRRRDG